MLTKEQFGDLFFSFVWILIGLTAMAVLSELIYWVAPGVLNNL